MAKDWNFYKAKIRELYHVNNKPLLEVMQVMETEYNFKASERSYRTHLLRWGLGKYTTQRNPKPDRVSKPSPAVTRRRQHRSRLPSVSSIISISSSSTTSTDILLTHDAEEQEEQPAMVASTPFLQAAELDTGSKSPPKSQHSPSRELNFQENPGGTQLHRAVVNKDIVLVTSLLLSSLGPNVQDIDGNQALHLAIKCSRNVIVRQLLFHGANINAKDFCGRSALHLAVIYGNDEALGILLHWGADVNWIDRDGNNALHHASTSRTGGPLPSQMFRFKRLLDAGCNANICNHSGRSAFHKLLIDAQNKIKTVPHLLWLDCVEEALKRGADVTTTQFQGDTKVLLELFLTVIPDSWIVSSEYYGDTTRNILRMFIAKGASPASLLSHKTPLTTFLIRNILSCLFLLEQTCATVDLGCRIRDGGSILHEFCRELMSDGKFLYERIRCMRILLERGADANAMDDLGHTPMALIMPSCMELDWHQKKSVVSVLLEYRADPWLKNSEHTCIMHDVAVARSDHTEAVLRFLLEHDRHWQQPQAITLAGGQNSDPRSCRPAIHAAFHAASWLEAHREISAGCYDLPFNVEAPIEDSVRAVLLAKHLHKAREELFMCPRNNEKEAGLRGNFIELLETARRMDVNIDMSLVDDLIMMYRSLMLRVFKHQ